MFVWIFLGLVILVDVGIEVYGLSFLDIDFGFRFFLWNRDRFRFRFFLGCFFGCEFLGFIF